jgi:hypothetical protein
MRFLLLLLLFPCTLIAQRFNWSTSAGYPGINNSYFGSVDLATDNDGNAYVFDYANIDQVCQGDTIPLASSGYNMYLYKFNPSGELLWGKAFGPGPGGATVTPLNLEFGSDNTLYALVHINASNIITYDSTYTAAGPSNVILSISENGALNWAKSLQFSCPACMMLEIANDRIYYQAGNTLIKSMEFDQTPDTNYTFYFDPGTAILSIPMQGSSVFSNGDILIAGLQRGDASFFEGDTLQQVGNPFLYNNITYLRLTADLQPVWANTFGSLHDPETHFIPLAIDENDQIYTAWEVLDTITIAGTTVIGDFNLWAGTLLSMSSAGTPLWLRELPSNNALQILFMLADNETDQIWFSGLSSSPTTIGDTVITPGVNGSPILAAVNSAAQFSRQTTLPGLPGGSKGRTLGKAGSGHYYLGGNLNNGSNYEINCIQYPGAKGLYLASFFDVPQNPPTPSISANGNLLTASPDFAGNIQWLRDGEPISGATQQSYEANENGQYSVIYNYDYGCEGADSSSVIFVETALQAAPTEGISIYPNPSTDMLQISTGNSGEIAIRIFSANGMQVKNYSTQSRAIDISELSNGIYYLQIIAKEERRNLRFTKW